MPAFLQRSLTVLRYPRFAGLLASTVTLGLAFSFVAPFLSIWATTKVGLSPLQFSVFMTAVTLSAIAFNTALGRWSDTRLSRRTLLLAGGAAGALGYTGYALLAPAWALVLVGMTLVALASVCFSQLFAHVREIHATDAIAGLRSSQVVSLVRVCFSVAWMAGPAVAAFVLADLGFTGLFLGAAGLYLLFLAGVWRYVPPASFPAGRAEIVQPPVWRALARRPVLGCFLAFAAVFAAHALNMMNLPLFITRVLGGSERQLGVAFCIGPIAEVPLMLWFGHIANRGNLLSLIRFGLAATAAYFVALSLATQPWHVFPVQALSGLSFAILTNIAILYFQDLLPRQLGLATSLYSNAGSAGNLLGFFVFGGLAQGFGPRGLLLVCAGLCAGAFALLTWARPGATARGRGVAAG